LKHICSSLTSSRTNFIKLAGAGVGVAILNPATALLADDLVHPRGYRITTGQLLYPDDYLASTNGKFWAIMQADGNFCVPESWKWRRRQIVLPDFILQQGDFARYLLWSSARAGRYKPDPGAFGCYATMQDDGNFCVYRGKLFLWRTVQAASYEPVHGNYAAQLNDDGNFCVYRLTPDGVPSSPLFSTNTASAPRT